MRCVSDIKQNRPAFVWLWISAFFILFAFIYECFSFGVYSASLICAFLYPLFLGTVPCLIFKRDLGRLWNDGVLLLLFGSILNGAFEIYGTASPYTTVLMIAGGLCLIIGGVIEGIRSRRIRQETCENARQMDQFAS